MALVLRLLEHNALAVNEMRPANGANASVGTHHLRGPIAREQVVDQGRYIADVDVAVLVCIGRRVADGAAAQQQVDQGRHVADVHAAVAVHVTTLERTADIRLPAFAFRPRPMIDIPILGIGLANLGCSNDI